jgi:type VI secretion system protein ImpA
MASSEVLDFERLLRPIADDQPAGQALRSDPALSAAFYAVREACQRARELERRAIEFKLLSDEEKENEPTPDSPNWRDVVSTASDLLADKSKDLWVAAWLVEGLARTNGFAGLRDGFRLIRQLCETFWGSIHPHPEEDDDGISHTVSQISSLNDTLATPILEIALIPASDSFRAFSSADYIDAAAVDRMSNPQERSRKIERGVPTMDVLNRAVSKIPAEELANILDDIDQAISEFTQLSKTFDDKCGVDAPPSSRIASTLVECQDRMRDLTRDVLGRANDGEEGQPAGDAAATAGPSRGVPLGGEVRNRGEAFQHLLKISDFFRRTEPHSPVSYALEQAVRWGKMTLPELMSDLISDESARREMFRRAGIPEASDSNN